MSEKHKVVQRGHDSSGRPLKGTVQAFQHFDRVNEKVGGKLVIVQGAFQTSGASASAGTHDKAGCFDIRTWNLTEHERFVMIREARRLGAAAWYRTSSQGFDPHAHWVLIGDAPLAPLAAAQISMYRKGFNGLGWFSYEDDFPYRPNPIRSYRYEEDELFTDKDRKTLEQIAKDLDNFRTNETKRDHNSRIRDRERFSKLITAMGQTADQLGLLSEETQDDATKKQLRKTKAAILDALRNDPDVDGVDNPGDPE